MGSIQSAICEECGHSWRASDGGGFDFWIYRCSSCHEERLVTWTHIQTLELRDTDAQPMINNLSDQQAEQVLGACACGGNFTSTAVIRCPTCKSSLVELGEPDILFD